MRRLTLLITLLICCLLSLPAQENQQANNPEMEFARMRELAADKDYVHAKQIGYDLLEANEAYHDVALYLARIHGWESSFDSAYALIDRVVEMEPGLYEAYATCADLAYWQNNKQKLEECSGRAIEIEPDSAGAFDSYILALQRAPSLSRQTELFGMYSFDHFSKPYVRNWHMLTAGAELPIKHGTIIPYINAGYQAGGNNTPASDVQFNLDAYLTLGRLNYALLALGFSPDGQLNYFPGLRAAAELWQALPKGFGLSAGLRYFYWDQSFTFLTFSAEKYAGNYWFVFRNYLFFKDYGVSGSYYLTARRYFESRYDFLSLTLGYGTAPDEPIDVISDLDRLNAVSARLEFSKKITPDIRLVSMLGYAWEEYADQEYRNRYDFRLGAYFVIKK
jgi:YaiO family outer membrane protein